MNEFDLVVSDMMREFGTTAIVRVLVSDEYNYDTSENETVYKDYKVNAMFFDYVEKKDGLGTNKNTLVQTGDKQVYIQPPHKTIDGKKLPHLSPNKDLLVVNGKVYKIITLKELNPSMTSAGSILFELYVRE